MSSKCNNITLAIRNAKSKIVCVMCKQCLVTANHDVCMLNYVNNMNSRADNQSANVLKRENQKKHKANVKKSKEIGPKGSLVSSKPSSPRSCLRWSPTGRIFNLKGKIIESSESDGQSDISVCDNASTSNPSEPSSKGFRNSTSFLGSSGLDLTYAPSTITTQQPTEGELDLLFEAMYDDHIGGQPLAAPRTVHAAQAPQVLQTPTASTSIAVTAPTPTNSSSQAANIPNTSLDVDELETQQQHVQQQDNEVLLQPKNVADNVPNAMVDGN
ncbi:hypothetical protein Tco_0956010 [Tanacetum coccineum]|uniref:Uncharacterized protein n=1 Tax=Tanacetum coccineum TaxID=301880 RepID=A0ABQ5E8R5_9ASTR